MANDTTPDTTTPTTPPAPTGPITDADIRAALDPVTPPPAPQGSAASTAPAAAPTSVPVFDVTDEGEIPQDAELIRMSRKAFASRMTRATKGELKARFGTDNPDEIKAQLEELKTFRAEKETQRVAQLSEIDRAKEEKLAIERERDEWKNKYRSTVTAHSMNQEQTRVERIAGQHLNPAYLKYEIPEFARHLKQNFSKEQLANLSDQEIDAHFQRVAQERPEAAKVVAREAPPPVRIAPLTNGPRSGDVTPPPPVGQQQPQSFSPSAPNALPAGSARAEAARQGYRW